MSSIFFRRSFGQKNPYVITGDYGSAPQVMLATRFYVAFRAHCRHFGSWSLLILVANSSVSLLRLLVAAAATGSVREHGDAGDYAASGISMLSNYALTATQVRTLYNENSAVRFGPLTGSP